MPDLIIDERRRCLYLDGREIQLSPQEFRLIDCLGRNVGQVVSKRQLLAALWPAAAQDPVSAPGFDPAAVDLVIFRLRQRLADRAQAPLYIETRRGFGYILHHARIVRGEPPAADDNSGQGTLTAAPAASTPVVPTAEALSRPWAGLTRREWEIFLLLGDERATRLTNRALAQQLQISEATLKKHLQHLYRKLGVANRSAAALLAMQARVG
ncbi:MAG: winged helix-turn-helix domain-containing protein [Caldilineaceae bacterium]|nr:winged helix-turn-helix domain-containing protein [Caldilineaceae bacterium]